MKIGQVGVRREQTGGIGDGSGAYSHEVVRTISVIKADLECGDEQAYIGDMNEAGKALDRALAIRKQKEEQKAAKAGGATS